MKKLIASSAIILLCLFSVHARVYETLVLSDGFKLQGYIMERVPGEYMKMQVESIVGTIDRDYIDDTQDVVQNNRSLMKITLNEEGIEALGGDEDLKPIEDNYAFNSVLGPVKVLLNGRNRFDYEFAPKDGCGEYMINEEIIVAIETTPRAGDAMRGLVDVIETSSDNYRGQIVKNVLGQAISMVDEEGVPYEDINVNEIVSMKVEGLDGEEDILKQAEFLDVVESDNYDEPLTGVILAKIYDDDSEKDQIVIYTLSDEEIAVPTNSITKFGREKNPDFKAGKKYTVNSGEVWVNGNKAKRYNGALEQKKNSYSLGFDAANKGAIEIKYTDLDDGELVVENKYESQFRNPNLLKMLPSRIVSQSGKRTYAFDDTELMNSHSNVIEQGRPNSKDVVKTIFKVNKPGSKMSDLYILFYKSGDKNLAYIIKILG